MAGIILARLLAHRAVLVKDRELPARGEGPHRADARRGAGADHRARDLERTFFRKSGCFGELHLTKNRVLSSFSYVELTLFY